MDATLRDIQEGRSPVGKFVLGEEMYNDLRRRTAEIERDMRRRPAPPAPWDRCSTRTNCTGGSARMSRIWIAASRGCKAGQGSGGQLLQYDSQYNQARGQIEGLRRSIADMRAAEFLKSDGMYEEWNRSLTALAQKVDEANTNPLMETTAAYDNLNGLAARTRDTLREFREDPKKFLRLRVF